MAFSDKIKDVANVFFYDLKMNPFKGVVDENSKSPHSRVLRTTWFTKMADTFKVFYGDVNPFNELKKSFSIAVGSMMNILDRANDRQEEVMPGSLSEFIIGPITSLISLHRWKLTGLDKKRGLFDILMLPVEGVISLLALISIYVIEALLFIPNKIAMLLFRSLHSPKLPLKIIGGVLGAIFFAPFVLAILAVNIVNIALTISLMLLKAAVSLALTLVAMPIVSIVNFVAYLKSYKLFNAIKTINIMIAEDNRDPAADRSSSKYMREILSASKRENFDTCTFKKDNNGEYVSLLIGERGSFNPSYELSAAENKDKPIEVFRALYKLNMFGIQGIETFKSEDTLWVNEGSPSIEDWCREHDIELEDPATDGLRKKLL